MQPRYDDARTTKGAETERQASEVQSNFLKKGPLTLLYTQIGGRKIVEKPEFGAGDHLLLQILYATPHQIGKFGGMAV